MFADVIVDISHENVDRTFEYAIPEELEGKIECGAPVIIPFGRSNREIKGFVVNIKDTSDFPPEKLKKIISPASKGISLEEDMIELAGFIKTRYGGTMNQALKTVLPIKKKSAPVVEKFIALNCSEETAKAALELFVKKKNKAKARLVEELISESVLPNQIVRDKLNISPATIRSLEKDEIIRVDVSENLREAFNIRDSKKYDIILNSEQQNTADGIWERYKSGDKRPSLIHGVTGSGKTEVYIDLIDRFIKEQKQAIVLIPEIALTFQTVLRFYRKFGNRISVINSRLTPAQKHDQLEKAKQGLVDIIIGPRSALFTPFKNLGIIIIDEEHEGTYNNENVPRYHSREVAIKRAEMAGAVVVLGSATPSVDTYYKAKNGEYALYSLKNRAIGAKLPTVEIADLRQELQEGNRSMISRRLDELIRERLERKEQIILFINRRGHSSFVSCRNCGTAIKCPHCDVSLKYHNNGKLICHYCGYEIPMLKSCPKCGSKYIGTFGSGTQKVEEEVNRLYPQAKTLRMDLDTTKEKDGHEKILSAFANGEADILVGTQMIVKGHDFANVTLVGIMAADLSLYSGDYTAPERTFQLLTQAAGRAGRGSKAGNVVIQTYSPEEYAIVFGAAQNFEGFYEMEMEYRKLLGYPPVMHMLEIVFSSKNENELNIKCSEINALVEQRLVARNEKIRKIGPADAAITKINDRFRKMMYLKSENYADLIAAKDIVEKYIHELSGSDFQAVFDFNK